MNATKFQCLLVSKDSAQYMLGSVPFSFADRAAASTALRRFKDGLTFEITNPHFDGKMKADFVSCPLKRVVMLIAPTQVTAVPPTSDHYNYPAKFIDAGMTLEGVLQSLAQLGRCSNKELLNFFLKIF